MKVSWKVVIVDDEVAELEKTKDLVEDYFRDRRNNQYSVETFSNPKRFMDQFALDDKADIYILDIVMPEINGIEIGTYIKSIHKDAKIIYLTTSEEFGVASYDVQAVDYLLKPCSSIHLQRAMGRVMDFKRQKAMPRFFVKVPSGIYALSQRDILYTEYYDHRLVVYTIDGRKIESITQREALAVLVEPLLNEENFLRISASFVVNMDHIVKLTKSEFEIADGRSLQISRTYSDSRSVYLDYILKNN